MARSSRKGPYVSASLLKKLEKLIAADEKKVILTWSRSSTIVPNMIGHTLGVHNAVSYTHLTLPTKRIV